MGALARSDDGFRVWLVQFSDAVAENAGSIDHRSRANLVLRSGLEILHNRARYKVVLFEQRNHWHVVHRDASKIENRLSKIDGEARVIELAIEVGDSTLEPLGFEGWNAPQRFFPGKDLRGAQTKFAGEPVINLHADAIERTFPPAVNRHDEGEMMNEVGRIFA